MWIPWDLLAVVVTFLLTVPACLSSSGSGVLRAHLNSASKALSFLSLRAIHQNLLYSLAAPNICCFACWFTVNWTCLGVTGICFLHGKLAGPRQWGRWANSLRYARQDYFKANNSKADDIHNKGANVFIIKHFRMPSDVVSTGKRRHIAAVLTKLKFYLEEMTAVSSLQFLPDL